MPDDALSCWIISDGRRGIENQALGLAEAVSRLRPLNIYGHIIENGKAFAAANPRLQFALKSKHTDYGLPKYVPDIAIGCGRQAIAPLMALQKAHPSTFTAYIQDPRIDPQAFDVVFAPEHDDLTGSNVETMIGSPNRVTDTLIIAQTLKFAEALSQIPMPRVAMMIGGSSKTHRMTKSDHAKHLQAAHLALTQGYSVLVTPSRRTPIWAIEDYKRLASDYDNVWLFDGAGENPYFAFLGGAEAILVTEDSTNMLTEACATGKPIFRLPMSGKAGKFEKLYESLSTHCNLAIFTDNFEGAPYSALLETDRVAEKFWVHFDARNAVFN